MKLNKFLAVAVAATVLPLSVAHAEGPAVNDVPEFTGGVNPADAPVLEKPAVGLDGKPTTGVNGPGLVNEKPAVGLDGKPTTGVNGPGLVNEKPEFKGGVNGAGLVNEKPEFKLPAGTSSDDTFGPRRGQTPSKTRDGHRTLPRTSAVK